LIAALRVDGVTIREAAIPALLFGPFGTAEPEPAKYAFLEEPYDVDDIFDSLWRTGPRSMRPLPTGWSASPPRYGWQRSMKLQEAIPKTYMSGWFSSPDAHLRLLVRSSGSHGPEFDAERGSRAGRAPRTPRSSTTCSRAGERANFARCDLDFSRYSNAAGHRALLDRFPGRRIRWTFHPTRSTPKGRQSGAGSPLR
jgi:hypothetical protein